MGQNVCVLRIIIIFAKINVRQIKYEKHEVKTCYFIEYQYFNNKL